jgi:PPOX class probable F420-dependent enzyme
MAGFDELQKHQYINLETFRRNGVSMKTPVWFVQEGNTVFVRTDANSGKVKRIRNNSRVNIALCKMDGTLQGEWIAATAREVNDENTDRKVDHLLDQKYGLMKKLFSLTSGRNSQKNTVLELKASE